MQKFDNLSVLQSDVISLSPLSTVLNEAGCKHNSNYHCKCHIEPEVYLTPLQRKNQLLKDYKNKIKFLELENDKNQRIIKNLENEVNLLKDKLLIMTDLSTSTDSHQFIQALAPKQANLMNLLLELKCQMANASNNQLHANKYKIKNGILPTQYTKPPQVVEEKDNFTDNHEITEISKIQGEDAVNNNNNIDNNSNSYTNYGNKTLCKTPKGQNVINGYNPKTLTPQNFAMNCHASVHDFSLKKRRDQTCPTSFETSSVIKFGSQHINGFIRIPKPSPFSDTLRIYLTKNAFDKIEAKIAKAMQALVELNARTFQTIDECTFLVETHRNLATEISLKHDFLKGVIYHLLTHGNLNLAIVPSTQPSNLKLSRDAIKDFESGSTPDDSRPAKEEDVKLKDPEKESHINALSAILGYNKAQMAAIKQHFL